MVAQDYILVFKNEKCLSMQNSMSKSSTIINDVSKYSDIVVLQECYNDLTIFVVDLMLTNLKRFHT